MAEYYSQLPQNVKQSQEFAGSSAKINEIRQLCENVEQETANSKLNDAQKQSFHFQMLCYLILDELPLAKYLFKRVPKEVKEMTSFDSIWGVGCSMWKSDHFEVYKKINTTKFEAIFKPFIDRLENNYRVKQVRLVSKAYTSIQIKELNTDYLGFKDIKELTEFIKNNKLSEQWTYDNVNKPTIINITKAKENYSELLDAKMLSQFTKYVCFMESQQKLTIDEINAAQSNKK